MKQEYYRSKVTFSILVIIFIIIVGQFFVPAVRDLFKGSILFLLPFAIFSLLGAILIFFTMKEKVKGLLKKFLILTGICSAGFFISVLLHNFLYALAIITKDIAALSYLMEIFSVVFFITAIFVCPIGFLIGAIGSITLFIKKR